MQRNSADACIGYMTSALEIEPGFLKARQVLRGAQVMKYKENKGGGMFGKLFSAVGSSPALAQAMANVHKDPGKAMEAAEKVLAGNPYNNQAHCTLAEAAMSMDLPQTAVFSLETAVEGDAENVSTLLRLARLYLDIGQPGKAQGIYDKVLKLEPANSEAYQGVKDSTAMAALKQGGWEDAESSKDVMKDRDEARDLADKARIFKDKDILQSQMESVYKQAQAEPNNVSLWKQLGDLAAQAGQFDYAAQMYRHAYELTGKADLNLEKLAAQTMMKKLDFQISQEEARLAAEPQNAEIRQAIGALKQDKERVLLEECESRAKRYPNDLDIRYELGTLFFRNGMVDKAIAEFQMAVNNPRTSVSCVNWLGKCFWKKGLLDLAVQRFKAAVAECVMWDGVKKEIVYNLGMVYEQMSKEEEAMEQYKSLYDVDVTFKDVGQKIEAYYKKKAGQA